MTDLQIFEIMKLCFFFCGILSGLVLMLPLAIRSGS